MMEKALNAKERKNTGQVSPKELGKHPIPKYNQK